MAPLGRPYLSTAPKPDKVRHKTTALDLITEADQESERAAIRTLNRAFPDHAILAEESGASKYRSEHRWIVDPLDGTTNFAHGFPQFCVSIAYERRGRLELSVAFDALKRDWSPTSEKLPPTVT